MRKVKEVSFIDPSCLEACLKESKYKNKSVLCETLGLPTATWNRLIAGRKSRMRYLQMFSDAFRNLKSYKEITVIDPTTFREETLKRCIKLDRYVADKEDFNGMTFETLKRYMYHTETFDYEWSSVLAISNFIKTKKVKNSEQQKVFSKKFNTEKNFINAKLDPKRKSQVTGRARNNSSTRILYFEPKDWKELIELMNTSVKAMSTITRTSPATLRTIMNRGNNSVSVELAELFSQSIMDKYRSRKPSERPKLPDRVKTINSHGIVQECDKRGITITKLYRLCSDFSETTIQTYYHTKYGKLGPRLDVMLHITEKVLSQPLLDEKEYAEFMARKEGTSYKDPLTDENNNPMMAEGQLWDFYSSQEEWISRDQTKLAHLPKTGQLRRFQK